MKKVLYVSNRTGFSGAEVVLLRLIQSNSEVEPIVLAPHGLLTERLQKAGVKVYFSSHIFQLNRKQNTLWFIQIIINLFLGFIEFANVILKEKPDIVHANGLGASIYSSVSSWFFRKPFIWTDHDVFEPGSLESNWTKRLSIFSKKIITVSHFVEKSLLKVGIAAKKIVTVYNGLDYQRFDPNKEEDGYFRKKYKIPKNKKIIAIFAMITTWKGQHILLEAAKSMQKNGRDDFVILIVGATDDQAYREELEKIVKKEKLREKIVFTGFIDNTIAAYKDIDILINASIKPEPFGTTIYEGMAMEKIVIVSDIGGNSEIVTNKKTGFLVPPSDPVVLAETVIYCLDNFETLREMKKSARNEVKEKFELRKMINNYNQIYNEIQNR